VGPSGISAGLWWRDSAARSGQAARYQAQPGGWPCKAAHALSLSEEERGEGAVRAWAVLPNGAWAKVPQLCVQEDVVSHGSLPPGREPAFSMEIYSSWLCVWGVHVRCNRNTTLMSQACLQTHRRERRCRGGIRTANTLVACSTRRSRRCPDAATRSRRCPPGTRARFGLDGGSSRHPGRQSGVRSPEQGLSSARVCASRPRAARDGRRATASDDGRRPLESSRVGIRPASAFLRTD
jgi:hypothetical protein